MIQCRLRGGVKVLTQGFTRTDIRAGQERSQQPSGVVAIAPLVTLTSGAPKPLRTTSARSHVDHIVVTRGEHDVARTHPDTAPLDN